MKKLKKQDRGPTGGGRFKRATPESKYWAFVKEVAQRVEQRPEWQRGAIDRPANTQLANADQSQNGKSPIWVAE